MLITQTLGLVLSCVTRADGNGWVIRQDDLQIVQSQLHSPVVTRSDVLRANDLVMHALPLQERGCKPDDHGAVPWNNIFGFQQIGKRKNWTAY